MKVNDKTWYNRTVTTHNVHISPKINIVFPEAYRHQIKKHAICAINTSPLSTIHTPDEDHES